MMFVSARGFVADEALADVDALDGTETFELFEDAVDACARDAPLTGAQEVLDLECGQRAGLLVEKVEYRTAGAAATVARISKRLLGARHPVMLRVSHSSPILGRRPACAADGENGSRARQLGRPRVRV